MPLASDQVCRTTRFGPKGWDIVSGTGNQPTFTCDRSRWATYAQRIGLRDRLASEGELGSAVKAAFISARDARVNGKPMPKRMAESAKGQQPEHRVRPKTLGK